jgi:NTP pyrophosphatase (non-canonical NTP hydrolase)
MIETTKGTPYVQEFIDYQEASAKTAIYPKDKALEYVALGLVGEAGEIANKVKKIIRDDNNVLSDEKRTELLKEAGDVLWYLSQFINELDGELGNVAQENIDKLYSRKERGVLKGSGDNR